MLMMRLSNALLLSPLTLSLCLEARAGPSWLDITSLRDCDELVQRNPQDIESYRCYLVIARRYHEWEKAARHIESLLARDPTNNRARLYLAALYADLGRESAVELYRSAASGFDAAGNHAAEVLARLSLSTFLRQRGRGAEARVEVERAAQAATASGETASIVGVWTEEGFLAYDAGDYGWAWTFFKKAERVVARSGPDYLRSMVLDGLAAVSWATGRYREAIDRFREEADFHSARGDYLEESRIRYNIALLGWRLHAAGEMAQADASRLGIEALDAAIRAHSADIEASARCLRAQDPSLTPSEAMSECEQALSVARQTGSVETQITALRLLAWNRLLSYPTDTDPAFDLVKQALDMARDRGDASDLARCRLARAYMRFRTGPREQAIADAMSALSSIESIRDLQRDDEVRARTFGEWTFAYCELSGYLLGPPGHMAQRDDIARAFAVAERMRARVLLDALDAARATSSVAPPGPLHNQRAAVLDRIAGAQRALMSGSLSAAQARLAIDELERLEIEEATLRETIARTDPRFSAIHRPVLASIAEVENALAPDEALLSYQLANRQSAGGAHEDGSWLFVATREGTAVYPLPDVRELQPLVEMFLGMIERRDGSEQIAAVRLYSCLLRPALDRLPTVKQRLVIVPDGILHLLPFDVLRRAPQAEPLLARYELSIAPSATLWRRWRLQSARQSPQPALVLADPALSSAGVAAGATRMWILTNAAAPPASLTYARLEGRHIVRLLGEGTELLEGNRATERDLKRLDLGRFGILHFATHVILDDETPARSAVLLAPGGSTEDGLLQIREIVALPLRGQVVVLSGCRTAGGIMLSGEGVMGIARAFLQAGAGSVAGNLWPLRDQDGQLLLDSLYRHLGEGERLGAALAAAKRARWRANAPAAAWAGLIVIGDADRLPMPRARSRIVTSRSLLTFLVILSAIAALTSLNRLGHRMRAENR